MKQLLIKSFLLLELKSSLGVLIDSSTNAKGGVNHAVRLD